MIIAFILSILTGCYVTRSGDYSAPDKMINADKPLRWFNEHNVDIVLSHHQSQQVYGLIALNRRGYFYPNIKSTREPLKLKAGCVTWLLNSSSDALKNPEDKKLAAAQQQFASRFNEAMVPFCLE